MATHDVSAQLTEIAGKLGLVPNNVFAERVAAEAAFTGFTLGSDNAADLAAEAGFTRVTDFGESDYWHFYAKPLDGHSLVFEYIEGDLRLYSFATVDAAAAFVEGDIHF